MEMPWEGISFFLFWDEGQLTQRACESVKSILTDSTVVYVRFLRGDSRPLWQVQLTTVVIVTETSIGCLNPVNSFIPEAIL